jgi:hypothetical protein
MYHCPLALLRPHRYFDKGYLELVTLGNFGRTSVTHNKDGASILPTTGTREGVW